MAYWKLHNWEKIGSYYKNEFGVMVDEEDFDLVKNKRISLFSNGYARIYTKDKGQVGLHRVILKFPTLFIDHINHNPADNRKCNLRICTTFQNAANLKINRKDKDKKTSKYKGVRFEKRRKVWGAQIGVNWKSIFLGYFEKEEDAAKAYDKAAKKYWGEFARTNF